MQSIIKELLNSRDSIAQESGISLPTLRSFLEGDYSPKTEKLLNIWLEEKIGTILQLHQRYDTGKNKESSKE